MVPVYASRIYDQNARLVQEGITPINLVSIMLGSSYRSNMHAATRTSRTDRGRDRQRVHGLA